MEWQLVYLRLPKGYFRIVIEADSGSGTTGLNVAIDDIWIGICKSGKILMCCVVNTARDI